MHYSSVSTPVWLTEDAVSSARLRTQFMIKTFFYITLIKALFKGLNGLTFSLKVLKHTVHIGGLLP